MARPLLSFLNRTAGITDRFQFPKNFISLVVGLPSGHFEEAWCEGESAPGFFFLPHNPQPLFARTTGWS